MPTRFRRQVLVALGIGAATFPFTLFAQQAAKRYRIGCLSSEAASVRFEARRLAARRSALRDLGYTDGKNIVIDARWADGQYDRLPTLAADLVTQKMDVIVTSGTKATLAAKNATATIPIVMGTTGDPIGLGFTTNLARPSGNVTGRTNMSPELGAKLLEVFKEAAPRIKQVAYLINPADPPTLLQEFQKTAKSLRLALTVFEASAPTQFESAFVEMVRTHSDAVVVQTDTLFQANIETIAQLARRNELPSASTLSDFAESGGLITYGPDRLEGFRRAAVFVDKLLTGSKPSDLPIERPTTFELVINLKTAKALGLTIPQPLLLRADEVIK